MKNKDNIIRQIYLSVLRDKKKIPEIINYTDINKESDIFGTSSAYNQATVSSGKSMIWKHFSEKINKNKVSLPQPQINPIIFPAGHLTHPANMTRIRMFLFRYYIGKVEWNKLFFGENT
jgi:hypothetical protein